MSRKYLGLNLVYSLMVNDNIFFKFPLLLSSIVMLIPRGLVLILKSCNQRPLSNETKHQLHFFVICILLAYYCI